MCHQCEKGFARFNSAFFRNLTRKMHILSVIAPEQLHRDGNFYKYLKLEQETERPHHILNILEKRFESVKNKAMKYFLC